MLAFVHIKLRSNAGKDALDKIASVKGVKEVYELFGEWDGILKIEAENTENLNFVVDEIRKDANIEMTSTMVVAQTLKP